MMIHAAINILILSVLLLIVGLWRPKFLLFWLDEPSRFAIIMIFLILVMVGMTLFGEGSRQKNLESVILQTEKSVTGSKVLPEIVEQISPVSILSEESTP